MRTTLPIEPEPVGRPRRRVRRGVQVVGAAVAVVGIAALTVAATTSAALAQGVGGGLVDGGPKASTTSTSGGSAGVLIAATIGTLVVIVAVIVVAVLVTRSRSTGRSAGVGPAPAAMAAPAPGTPVSGPPPLPADGGRSVQERDRLVQVLIELGDQLDSVALRAWVTQALGEVGVTTIVVDGRPFDPARHQAIDQIGTADPAAVGHVAQTVRAGFSDRERLLRLPQVVVYRAEAAP